MATTYEYSTEVSVLKITAKNSANETVEESYSQIPRGCKAHYTMTNTEGGVENPSVVLYDPEGFVIVEFSAAKPENVFKDTPALADIYYELQTLINNS